ncbi:MAG: 4a-hydroxytetrahydrobiopterin dehydratase [Jiangellales bacterium]
MADVLSPADLEAALSTVPAWAGTTESIERTITAPSFVAAISIVDDVALEAEQANHHPDIDIRWRKVRFGLSTHDAGGVTALDLDLAARIDRIASHHGAA